MGKWDEHMEKKMNELSWKGGGHMDGGPILSNISGGGGHGCTGRDVRDVGRRPCLSDLHPCWT